MGKTTTCLVCKKRRASPDNWKSDREKGLCFSCYNFEKFLETLVIAAKDQAKRIGLKIEAGFKIERL